VCWSNNDTLYQLKRCYSNLKHCKYGFLYDINLENLTKVNRNTNRWEYFRLEHFHWKVVPYHPTLFLIWGAHLNNILLLVILKYNMKVKLHGILNTNTRNAKWLGLQNVNDKHLKLISTMILAKLVTSTKVAITCLDPYYTKKKPTKIYQLQTPISLHKVHSTLQDFEHTTSCENLHKPHDWIWPNSVFYKIQSYTWRITFFLQHFAPTCAF
jgi:hypothetical protein